MLAGWICRFFKGLQVSGARGCSSAPPPKVGVAVVSTWCFHVFSIHATMVLWLVLIQKNPDLNQGRSRMTKSVVSGMVVSCS